MHFNARQKTKCTRNFSGHFGRSESGVRSSPTCPHGRERPITKTFTKAGKFFAAVLKSIVGHLFIVATPIGNLNDITLRALETLKTCDGIACEDTRRTRILLQEYGIDKPLISCRARNEKEASQKILQLLDAGKRISYVSDAGTPGISDPGSILTATARAAGHSITAIPGVSAFTAIVSIAGLPFKSVLFEGFLPQKGLKRKKRLAEILSTGNACVLYESPYRIVKLFEELCEVEKDLGLDKSGKKLHTVVGRELTKMHEETIFGTAQEVLKKLQSSAHIKGEFCIFVTAKA